MQADFEIVFKPSGRGKAQCAADPNFPNGLTMVMAEEGAPACRVELPYPAPECGGFIVRCKRCAFSVYVTAAGRADDPKALVVPCKDYATMGDEVN